MDYILQNFDKIYSILVLLVGSLFIKITLNFAKQTWSETFHILPQYFYYQ